MLCAFKISAQLVVTPSGGNYTQLVQNNLVGPGVTISNVQYTGGAGQIGSFTAGGNTNLGLAGGIVMATCNVNNIPGPASTSMSNNMNGAGVAELTQIVGVQTRDGAVLSFDVLPQANTITFRYVFASEEWPENPNPNAQYYDAFAFFISGPGFPNPTNIALLPSLQPVSIQTVNPATNTQYYVDNGVSTTIKFDGLTTVLTATAQVQPCQSYSLKLMIADAVNGFKDSGVFLEASSLSSPTITATSPQALPNSGIAEACTPASIDFTLPFTLPQPITINYVTGGTATSGTDYTPLPGSITIPAGQTQASVLLTALQDNVTENQADTFKLIYTIGCVTDTLEILINDAIPLQVNAGNDITICQSQQVNLQPQITGGSGTLTYAWTENGVFYSNNQNINPTPTLTQTDYILTVTDACGNTEDDTVTVNLSGNITATFTTNSPICGNNPAIITYTGNADTTSAQFTWNFGGGAVNSQQGQVYDVSYNGLGTYTVTLDVISQGCPPVSFSQQIQVTNGPQALFVAPAAQCITNNSFDFASTGQTTQNTSYLWNFGANGLPSTSQLANPAGITFSTTGTQIITLTVSESGCTSTYIDSIITNPAPVVLFSSTPNSGCAPLVVSFTDLSGIPNATYVWDFGNGNTSTQQNPINTYTAEGSYDVTLTVTANGQSCSGVLAQPGLITVTPSPVASFIASPALTDEYNANITLTSTANGATNCIYILPDNSIINDCDAEIILPDTGTYNIIQVVTSSSGCVDTAYNKVVVYPSYSIYIPNAFSPDGDGINEIFKPQGRNITEYQFDIYDRWGVRLFSTDKFTEGWDGTVNGKIAPIGVYVYQIKFIAYAKYETIKIGKVSLIR